MDNLNNDASSTGLEPLFIREEKADPDRDENENPSGLSFTAEQLKQSALIKPYLQEMDDLLKRCQDLTGVPLVSQHSAGFTQIPPSESSCIKSKDEFTTKSYEELYKPPQTCTSYIDTHMSETENETARGQSSGDLINSCEVSKQREMPLSETGNKLSATMVEYEGQLLGMLAMLESCMEEAEMDFEPQRRAADTNQEYVHMNKIPHRYKGTTLLLVKPESPPELETQLNQLCVNGGKASKETRKSRTGSSTGNGSQESLLSGDEMMSSRLEMKPDEQSYEFWLLQADDKEHDPKFSEETKSKEKKGDVTDDSKLLTEDRCDIETNKLRALGSQMEDCIEEVQLLQTRRKELLVEVLQLRGHKEKTEERSDRQEDEEDWIDSKVVELMDVFKSQEEERRGERKRERCSLREERAEEERRIWKVNLERLGLQEEVRRLKRRLFAVARDCAHSQAALNSQRREVELLKREEEKLNSLVLQLTEDSCQLKSVQRQQLSDLQAKLHAKSSSQNTNTQEELTQSRRHSCSDVQQYLQSGLKALEDRYEPILLALLKRRKDTASVLMKAKEQIQELRAQLGPLREEIQKLKLQRACLEEKLKLKTIQRLEDVGCCKEAVYYLEEQSRELKTELEIQKRKIKEMEELRENLTKQLLLYRASTECDQEKKT